jgi:hypothetical protein
MKYNSIDSFPSNFNSFEAEKRFNFRFIANQILIKIGSIFLTLFLLNTIWSWIKGQFLLSWDFLSYLILAILLIEVIKSDIHKPAFSICIDENNRCIKLHYSIFFVFRSHKEFDFKSLKIKLIDNESNSINRVLFLDSSNNTICYVDKNEELFTQHDFAKLCAKLESITISK